MAEPSYRKAPTKPKTRVSTTRKGVGFIDDTGRGNTEATRQLNASTRTGAFVPPPGDRNPQVQSTGTSAAAAAPIPMAGDRNPQFQASTTGGRTSAAAAVPPESEKLFGFAGRHFTNADLPTVWENPWLIVNAALDDRGQGGNTKLKEMMRQYGEMGLPIFTMLQGLTGDTSNLGSAETINWISRWINSMSQLGGHVPSYEGLLGQLLQGRGTDTVLGEALNSGTGQDQVNTLMTYLRSALGTNSLNPIASSAVLSQANREGDNFLEASMGGQDGYQRNFTDFINSGGHRLFGDPRY